MLYRETDIMQKKEHRKVNTDFQMPIRIIEVIEYSCTKHEFFSENYKSLLELFAPDTPPATIVMEYFADALVEKINQLSEDQIRAVFDYMERRLVDGDDVVSYSIR